MTWRQITAWVWRCEGCQAEHVAGDDAQPAGWVHTQDGRDLCGECSR